VPLTLTAPPQRVLCPYCGSAGTERVSEFSGTACKALHRCRDCRQPFEHFKEL
jgi:ring-1,2-phenylacetyl-CoA epoxidase subunit PaaD